MKYSKVEYLKYVKEFKKEENCRPISYKTWKVMQPIADKVVGRANQIIKRSSIK